MKKIQAGKTYVLNGKKVTVTDILDSHSVLVTDGKRFTVKKKSLKEDDPDRQ